MTKSPHTIATANMSRSMKSETMTHPLRSKHGFIPALHPLAGISNLNFANRRNDKRATPRRVPPLVSRRPARLERGVQCFGQPLSVATTHHVG
jgi:hypothetical protein